MLFLIVLGVGLGTLWLIRHAVLRFIEQQRRSGRWDAEGPLVETEAPSGNRGMNERLEVIGEYHGRILRDRRPKSDVLSTGEASNADEGSRSEPPTVN